MFYLIRLFARSPGFKEPPEHQGVLAAGHRHGEGDEGVAAGFLGKNFETVLHDLRAEGIQLPFPDGTIKKVLVKFTFVSDMSALVKLIDGIGSVTALHSCHLCHETRQEREDFTRSRREWPEPRT